MKSLFEIRNSEGALMRTLFFGIFVLLSFPLMAEIEGEKEALKSHIRAHYQKV